MNSAVLLKSLTLLKSPGFKQDFLDDLQLVFVNLVDLTEPICQAIDSAKADMTIFDSSGIEAFVTENNPKYANRIIKQLKAYAKAQGFDKSYDPYKAAYGSMPSHASANPEINSFISMGILLCLQVRHCHQRTGHHPPHIFL